MTSLEDVQKRFTDELQYVDDVAQVVLKGHLVMESLMTESIQTYLLHGEFLEDARFSAWQKITICRAISKSDQNNSMWRVISSLNALRNALSHSLDAAHRAKAIDKLRAVYEAEFKDIKGMTKGIPDGIEKDMPSDLALCLFAFAGAHGYLHAHLEEVRRLKAWIIDLDAALNDGGASATDKARAQ